VGLGQVAAKVAGSIAAAQNASRFADRRCDVMSVRDHANPQSLVIQVSVQPRIWQAKK
jgi:hypothetical protein